MSKELVFFLEEASAKAMLETILRRISQEMIALDNIAIRHIIFEGKQDLDKKIEKKLKGYLNPNAQFIILRDQDSSNCVELKENLLEKVKKANKLSQTHIRIACKELESFYLGDLDAVKKAFPKVKASQETEKYRDPDKLDNSAQELKRITNDKYQKIAGSRKIANYLDLGMENKKNRSKSFCILLQTIISNFKN